MHGAFVYSFRRFVQEHYGSASWDELLSDSIYREQPIVPSSDYPGLDFRALVDRLARQRSIAPELVLEPFGQQLVRTLLGLYGAFVAPHWRTLDVVENARQTIHRILRMRDGTARPPRVMCCRLDAASALLVSVEPQCHCAIIRGALQGVAAHFGETIELKHSGCQMRGDRCCELLVELPRERSAVPAGAARGAQSASSAAGTTGSTMLEDCAAAA